MGGAARGERVSSTTVKPEGVAATTHLVGVLLREHLDKARRVVVRFLSRRERREEKREEKRAARWDRPKGQLRVPSGMAP